MTKKKILLDIPFFHYFGCGRGDGYNIKEFAKNMCDLGMQIINSSARHPASNGCTKRGIKTVKEQLKKHGQISTLQLAEVISAYIHGSNQVDVVRQWSFFLGQGTKTELPNSLIRSFEWSYFLDTENI